MLDRSWIACACHTGDLGYIAGLPVYSTLLLVNNTGLALAYHGNEVEI